MKKVFSITAMFLAAMIAVGCGEDDITVINDTTGNTGIDIVETDTTCNRTIAIVFSTSSDATVSNTGDNISATVSGNDVTILNLGTEKVNYQLFGSTTDGYLKIYSSKKQVVTLNNVSIKNTRGAAINVQGAETNPADGKSVNLVLNGSNSLADGGSYTLTPSNEDEKGVLFCEGKIIVSGSGTLNVNASVDSKKGICSDNQVVFNGGSTTIAVTGGTVVNNGDTTSTAGVKADEQFYMNAGSLTITNSGKGGKGISCDGTANFIGGTVDITVTGANFGSSSGGYGPGGHGSSSDKSVGAKGIKCDGNIIISGGIISVKASNNEGIESKGTLTITGGQTYSQSSDDAINSASDMTISGGVVCAYSTGNDGIDANGNCYIQGGVIYAIGKNSPEMAIDANTEASKKLYIQGGTIIAIGSLENGAQLTQACYQASSWSKNVWYSITVGVQTYAFKTPSGGGNKLVVSGSVQPVVNSNVTVSGGTEMCNGMLVDSPTVSGGNSVNLSNYTSSGGGPGGW